MTERTFTAAEKTPLRQAWADYLTSSEYRQAATVADFFDATFQAFAYAFAAGSLRSKAETPQAALAEAQQERDAAEESARQMQDRLQRVVDGAATERQQVTALREFVRDNYKILLKKMDSLGLTGTEPTE